MKRIINLLLSIFKYLLYLIAFTVSFYIVVTMNKRLNKNFISSFTVFIPHLLLLLLFFINIIFKQKQVTRNLFYNLTCCLVFLTTILIGYRAIYDTNMILNEIMGYNINFVYFSDYIKFMKILIYGLCIGNIFFMFQIKDKTT